MKISFFSISFYADLGSMSARYRYDEFGLAEAPEKFDLNGPGPDNLFGYTSLGYDYYSGYSHAQARDFDEGQLNDLLSLSSVYVCEK